MEKNVISKEDVENVFIDPQKVAYVLIAYTIKRSI